ncbi:MAG: hypothetical protein MZV64_19920, partial [Ignavibacteriales bacterium]|nr:hypothetical protein [Ignavibacteriales bacterium]
MEEPQAPVVEEQPQAPVVEEPVVIAPDASGALHRPSWRRLARRQGLWFSVKPSRSLSEELADKAPVPHRRARSRRSGKRRLHRRFAVNIPVREVLA